MGHISRRRQGVAALERGEGARLERIGYIYGAMPFLYLRPKEIFACHSLNGNVPDTK